MEGWMTENKAANLLILLIHQVRENQQNQRTLTMICM